MNFANLKGRLDPTPLVGMTLGGLCVTFVLLGEGRHLNAFISLDAFMVVVGGSLGASLISLRAYDLAAVLEFFPALMGWVSDQRAGLAQTYIRLLRQARRQGFLSLEPLLEDLEDPVMRRAVQQLVDGGSLDDIKKTIELEKEKAKRRARTGISFYESLGGFAPTFGIVGTVVSLTSVLSHLHEPELLAGGVAEAFLATFYGVLFANLVFLPLSARMQRLLGERLETLDMVLIGIVSLESKENPSLLLERFTVFVNELEKEPS